MKQVWILLAFVLIPLQADAQFSITGTVRDGEGNALTGANVVMMNTFLGTSTDTQGWFRLTGLKSGEYTITVSYVGYLPEEKKIMLEESRQLEFVLHESALMGEEVVVSAVRATQNTPATFSLVSGEALVRENPGKDLPYLIANEPSVTTTSDAGNGVGYTGIRIRGSDMTRINVTINGIPVNDPESHNVFWVDLPDLAGSINNLQIQRGVGSSTNGAGAFGASINIETDAVSHKSYGEISTVFGSFNTWKNTVKFGTGLLNDHWFIDGRASMISSDGYIDRAAASLKSFYLQTGYFNAKTLIKAVVFSGLENTCQAWYGVDAQTLDTARTFNWAGVLFNENGSLSFYDNQVDHYQQDYYQLHFSHQMSPRFMIHLAGHYTYGRGYYEEYMQDQSFTGYGMQDLYFGRDSSMTGDAVTYFYHDTVNTTDLIRRRWLDNDFYGFTYSLQYNRDKTDITLGGAVNKYDNARHYGEVIWAEFASQTGNHHIYYDNSGWKADRNIYLKVIYRPVHRLSIYVDLQYRNIHYMVSGYEPDSQRLLIDETFHFMNPKAGITYTLPKIGTIYASYSIANREPIRDDYISAAAGEKPEHETLYNLEAGIRGKSANSSFEGNIFLMNYRNQLVLTGEINEDGAFIRKNAGKSYRAGLELSGTFRAGSRLLFDGNLSLSRNKTNYNRLNAEGLMEFYENSDISFSPWLIGFMQVRFIPVNEMTMGLSGKYVSRQYLDNTQNQELSLDDYFLSDFNLGYKIHLQVIREIELILKVNNLLNHRYESNGYVYYGQPWFYPQAGINFLAGITCRW
jgi:iron complex outermembrane receptor protein